MKKSKKADSRYHEVPPPKEFTKEAEEKVEEDNRWIAHHFNKEEQVKAYLENLFNAGVVGILRRFHA